LAEYKIKLAEDKLSRLQKEGAPDNIIEEAEEELDKAMDDLLAESSNIEDGIMDEYDDLDEEDLELFHKKVFYYN
jgi:hypothetical protein